MSRTTLFRTIAAAVSLLLAVVVLEIVVRLAFHNGMDFTLEMWKYARYVKRISPDPALGHEHVPGASARLMGVDVTINSRGLRERDIPYEKPAGTRRILMLGDSLTFGWGVHVESTASKVLERELNARRRESAVEVINAGVGNYNASMSVQYLLHEGRRYDADVVVLNYFINDAEETPRYSGNFMSERLQSWAFLAAQLDSLRRRFGSLDTWNEYYSGLYDDGKQGWRETRAAVIRLGQWCRERQIQCLFVNQPELHHLKDYPFIDVNHKLERLAAEAGLEYVDLLPSVRDEPEETLWVTVADPHPNGKACTLFGKALAAHLDGRI